MEPTQNQIERVADAMVATGCDCADWAREPLLEIARAAIIAMEKRMEPTQNLLKIYLGSFQVIEVGQGKIIINMGKGVHVTIFLSDLSHEVKPGQQLPLFTEIPYANLRSAH
jgi:hypothetical protein